ncbi:MAG TPA: hypothetical protein VFN10_07565 [Thermoanaerobaculia bacterium]|nr:hypothetical protein [Thermoanaerobaculia bacterium]
MRLAAALLALLLGACCSSLPKLSPKHVAFVAPAAASPEVTESRAVWHDAARNRDVPVTIYAPAGALSRLPVVVFSHGIGEDRDSYAYLGRALAQQGFLTVHVTHAGTDRAVLKRGYRFLYRAVKEKANWVARPLDVSFVLDELEKRGDADVEHAAIVGHSAGAFTAFALAGMRTATGETMVDPRIKVAVPISMPRLDGVVAPGGYDAITIPVLNLTGTCDTSLIYRTFPKHRRIPFESTHAQRQYLVTLEGVNHDMFSAREDLHHPLFAAIVASFLRAWMFEDAHARAWFDDTGSGEAMGVRVSVERK